ncbi:MAG: acyl-CoA desaturase [Fluviicoccus sp.]|uniref:fatty acid desaturase family protein n=1 Tax=Fluviicoccus sp. TaxID=2003552 RepID=UPI002720905E|nr:acyl-CoA desaturase [Fluviicoccus sp.]MDO8331195.1 acyl-CoA desaturase [Fluviicoccus sp.]
MTKPGVEKLDAFGQELDALRDAAMADLGQRDANHIRGVIRIQRYAEIGGRALLLFGFSLLAWPLGVALLALSKILNNMEVGHNVMHGQYDWMNDPELHSQSHDWDNICDPDSWRKTHNFEHHSFTNIIGKDRDFGYGAYRLQHDMPWEPRHRYQIPFYILMALLFQWGLGLHDLEAERIRAGEITRESKQAVWRTFLQRAKSHMLKDYLLWPLLAMPLLGVKGFLAVMLGNFLANTIRNVWASAVIFCGHFTDNVQTFQPEECENESRGQWYYRQILGSSNFRGGRWMHIMTGHLSYQIEHHLFPDIPAHRYAELGPKVEAICARYGVAYNTGRLGAQYVSVLKRLARYSVEPGREEQLV